jgi:stalled ribosome alternative rescue factor ArfA
MAIITTLWVCPWDDFSASCLIQIDIFRQDITKSREKGCVKRNLKDKFQEKFQKAIAFFKALWYTFKVRYNLHRGGQALLTMYLA